jgi:hypothetical protein
MTERKTHERTYREKLTPEQRAVIERIRAAWKPDPAIDPTEQAKVHKLKRKYKFMDSAATRRRMRTRGRKD